MKRVLLRAASVLAAVLVAASLSASSASASPTILQRFSVPSGDSCAYGYTNGHLEWRSTVPASAVRLAGVVGDRPIPNDPGSVCRDDNRYTVATYRAYAGERLVDETARRADNGTVAFDVVLGVNSVTVGVDRVLIQVCRYSLYSTDPSPVPDYCGRQYTYTPSGIGPAEAR